MRLEEEKTQVSQSLTNLGEVLYSKYQIYYFKDSSPPFIGERTGHEFAKKLTKEAIQGFLATLPLLVPKMESEGIPSRLFLKLTSKDALHKRYL